MSYTFEILGVLPILQFFCHQQRRQSNQGPAYIGTHRCTLDAFLTSLDALSPQRSWEIEHLIEATIHFWIHHPERIERWQQRLFDAGNCCLLVARVGNVQCLRAEFELLLRTGSDPYPDSMKE